MPSSLGMHDREGDSWNHSNLLIIPAILFLLSSLYPILSCSDGELVRTIADLPLAEDIPVAFDSCRKGPRHVEWRDDRPAEVAWIECQVCFWEGVGQTGDLYAWRDVYLYSTSDHQHAPRRRTAAIQRWRRLPGILSTRSIWKARSPSPRGWRTPSSVAAVSCGATTIWPWYDDVDGQGE